MSDQVISSKGFRHAQPHGETYAQESLNHGERTYMIRVDPSGKTYGKMVSGCEGSMYHRGLYDQPAGTKYWTFVPATDITSAVEKGVDHLREWHMFDRDKMLVISDTDEKESRRRAKRLDEHKRRMRRRSEGRE